MAWFGGFMCGIVLCLILALVWHLAPLGGDGSPYIGESNKSSAMRVGERKGFK